MIKNATELLQLLELFYPTQALLCRVLRVTPPTLQRWQTHKDKPSNNMIPNFERALSALQTKCKKVPALVELIDEYEVVYDARRRGRPKADMVQIEAFLKKQLERPRESFIIMENARAVGFTKQMIYRAAKNLFVRMDVKGIGRNSSSTWSLPD